MENQIKYPLHPIYCYDIQDEIIEYLDIESLFQFLQTCKSVYSYTFHQRYNYILCKKITDYFDSFKKINLFKKFQGNIQFTVLKEILYKFYIDFKFHPETYLSEFLYDLTNNVVNETTIKLFEELISYCSFTKSGENRYNFIKADDLQFLIMNSNFNHLQLIKKYINIPIEVLEYSIFLRINEHQNKEAKLLIEYLFYKHFWKFSEYIQDHITTLITKCILYDNKYILDFIYNKRQHYRFLVNYQRVLTFLVSQKSIKYIDYIEEKRIQQNEECELKDRNDLVQKIIITPVSIQNMVINKNYNVLAKIINIYLGNAININRYSKYILQDEICLKVLKEMKITF
jgi:hypothetical protein